MFSIFSHQATWILRQTRLGCNTPRYQEVRFPNWQFCTRHPLHPCWSWHPEMAKLAYLGVFFCKERTAWFFLKQKSLGAGTKDGKTFFFGSERYGPNKELLARNEKDECERGEKESLEIFTSIFSCGTGGKFTSPATPTQGTRKSFTGRLVIPG